MMVSSFVFFAFGFYGFFSFSVQFDLVSVSMILSNLLHPLLQLRTSCKPWILSLFPRTFCKGHAIISSELCIAQFSSERRGASKRRTEKKREWGSWVWLAKRDAALAIIGTKEDMYCHILRSIYIFLLPRPRYQRNFMPFPSCKVWNKRYPIPRLPILRSPGQLKLAFQQSRPFLGTHPSTTHTASWSSTRAGLAEHVNEKRQERRENDPGMSWLDPPCFVWRLWRLQILGSSSIES